MHRVAFLMLTVSAMVAAACADTEDEPVSASATAETASTTATTTTSRTPTLGPPFATAPTVDVATPAGPYDLEDLAFTIGSVAEVPANHLFVYTLTCVMCFPGEPYRYYRTDSGAIWDDVLFTAPAGVRPTSAYFRPDGYRGSYTYCSPAEKCSKHSDEGITGEYTTVVTSDGGITWKEHSEGIPRSEVPVIEMPPNWVQKQLPFEAHVTWTGERPDGRFIVAWQTSRDTFRQYVGLFAHGTLPIVHWYTTEYELRGARPVITSAGLWAYVFLGPEKAGPMPDVSEPELRTRLFSIPRWRFFAIVDLEAGVIHPVGGPVQDLLGATGGGYDETTTAFAVLPGPSARVVDSDTCLNVRAEPAIIGCYADGVPLRTTLETADADGRTWLAVSTPGGESGWAAAGFLEY